MCIRDRCKCRKPEPGMLQKAAADYHIELKNSWMVGDGNNDMAAGRKAGCHTAGICGCEGGEKNFRDLKACLLYTSYLSLRHS